MSILDIFQDRKGEVLFLFMTDKEKCLCCLKRKMFKFQIASVLMRNISDKFLEYL